MNRFLQLGVNKEGRDFVIGDIHGKYTQLMYQLDQYAFDFEKDRLFAVGDLVDRGTENMKCLGLIGEPWFYTVIGNHDLMMALALTEVPSGYTGKGSMQHWTGNGGMWYYKLWDYEVDELKETYVPLILDELPLAIEFVAENGKRVGITHGGLPKAWSWTQTRKAVERLDKVDGTVGLNLLWTRDRAQGVHGLQADILGIDLLINGHTPSKKPVWVGNNVFIDQGVYNKYTWEPYLVMDLLNELQERDEAEVEVE